MATKKLGRQLLESLTDINMLIGSTTNPDRIEELLTQRNDLLGKISSLVDKNLDKATVEYKNATKNLKAASAKIQKAIKGLESIANAIKSITKALDSIGKVLAA